MYTKEQNEEIEKVCRVFDSYIRENPYFDVVWSDKLGYIYLSGIAPDREGVCMAPLILRTESRPGIFGGMNHYDSHGHKTGSTRPGILGGANHYDDKGHKTGHSNPGILGGWNHYDD